MAKKDKKPTNKKKPALKQTPAICSPKLLDLLTRAVDDAGFSFLRDGWTETIPVKDECGWLDIHLPWVDDKRYCVHFYFDKNEQRLTEVSVWVQKRKYTEEDAELVSKCCI